MVILKQKIGLSTAAAMRLATWAITGLSLLIALVHYLGGRALWLDEAMIALNLDWLSWGEVTGKLELDQLAPVGWLLVEKALLTATGSFEYGLRLFSLAMWIGALFSFLAICRRCFTPLGGLFGYGLFALSGTLLGFAVEVKPYAADVFVAAAGLALSFDITEDRGARRPWLLFGALGVFAALFTFGGVLALAAEAAATFFILLKGRRSAALAVAGLAAGWLVLFAILMVFVYRPQLHGSGLVQGGNEAFFARTSFAPLPPKSLGDLRWFADWLISFLSFVFGPSSFLAAAILIGVGLVRIAMHRWIFLLMALGPLLIGFAASATHAYPMFERLSLFTLPGLFFAAAAALDWLFASGRAGRWAAGLFTAAAAFASIVFLAGMLHSSPPFARHEVRPALRIIASQAAPTDRILIDNISIPSWLLYRDRMGLGDRDWVAGGAHDIDWGCTLPDIADLKAGDVIWRVTIYNAALRFSDNELAQALALRGLSGHAEIINDSSSTLLTRVRIEAGDRPAVAAPKLECPPPGNRFDVPERFRGLHIGR